MRTVRSTQNSATLAVSHAASDAMHHHEPVGIVIADGGAAPRPTRFSAFVWGPAPTAAELEALDRLLQDSASLTDRAPNAKDAGRQADVLAFGEPAWVPDDVMATA